MKEGYFTGGNINEKSREILETARVRGLVRHIDSTPERSALLVIDMQRYFLDSESHAYIPSAVPVVPRIRELAGRFNERGLPVVLTRHVNTERNAGMLARWWIDMIREDDPLSEIIEELAGLGNVVVKKTQYDAFHMTELEQVLKERGVDRLVIGGVVAHLCCETTARSAFVRGFEVLFLVDGTAAYDEDFHRATVLNLAHGFAVPVLADDVMHHLGE
jgi:bifunctional isochorismate lyase/aryl carrier protein